MSIQTMPYKIERKLYNRQIINSSISLSDQRAENNITEVL